MVYPPGIPIFIPGEIITEDNIVYTRKNIEPVFLFKVQKMKN
jgi:lysine decarboxylase